MWKRAYLLLLVVCACTSDDREEREPTPSSPCERLRDHLIDLRLTNQANIDVEKHREALKNALGKDFIEACRTTMSPSEISCATEAGDAAAVQRCTPRDRVGGQK